MNDLLPLPLPPVKRPLLPSEVVTELPQKQGLINVVEALSAYYGRDEHYAPGWWSEVSNTDWTSAINNKKPPFSAAGNSEAPEACELTEKELCDTKRRILATETEVLQMLEYNLRFFDMDKTFGPSRGMNRAHRLRNAARSMSVFAAAAVSPEIHAYFATSLFDQNYWP